MDDNGLQSAEEALLERLAECSGAPGGTAESRWQFLITRPTTAKIFHLLLQCGEMYVAEIARAIERKPSQVQEAVRPLLSAKIAEAQKRGHRLYFKLVPEAVDQYQKILKSPNLLTPMYLRIFRLLIEHGEVYQQQMLDALHLSITYLQPGIDFLLEIEAIELEYRQGSFGKKFYRIRPDVLEVFQQWRASQEPVEPKQ